MIHNVSDYTEHNKYVYNYIRSSLIMNVKKTEITRALGFEVAVIQLRCNAKDIQDASATS